MAETNLQLVVVTPEVTLIDQPVESMRFPLYDGQIGILPGRAPLVGKLGYGELKIRDASGDCSYFIDGGFVQIKGPVVSLLTNQAIPVDKLDRSVGEEALKAANATVAHTVEEFESKFHDQERARRIISLAQ